MSLSNSIPNSILQPGVCTSSTRPASPYKGQAIYETDTDEVLVWNGVTWRKPWRQPWGFIAYGEVTSNPTAFSTMTDLPGASVTFTAVANRRYRVSAQVLLLMSAANGQGSLYIRTSANVQIQAGVSASASTLSGFNTVSISRVITPAAGSTTYKLSATLQAGTGTVNTSINGDRPDFILVEDIGPNGVPA